MTKTPKSWRKKHTGLHRYGFNGKENDRVSWSSTQLVQDYGFRLYNPAIGKFLSVDPITAQYPELTPYQFASNTPIMAIDLDGLEGQFFYGSNTTKNAESQGQVFQKGITGGDIIDGVVEGMKQLFHDLAPIRPADENDPKTLGESWERIKQIPTNIKNIPSNLKKVYAEGTVKEKAKATVVTLGIIATFKKGGPKAMPGVVLMGFKLSNLSKLNGLTLAAKFKNEVLRSDYLNASIKYGVQEGKISFEGMTPGKIYSFVINNAGELKIGEYYQGAHFDLAGGAKSVQGAGTLTFDIAGKIKDVTNNSGHYTPSFEYNGLTIDALKANNLMEKSATNTGYSFPKDYYKNY